MKNTFCIFFPATLQFLLLRTCQMSFGGSCALCTLRSAVFYSVYVYKTVGVGLRQGCVVCAVQ